MLCVRLFLTRKSRAFPPPSGSRVQALAPNGDLCDALRPHLLRCREMPGAMLTISPGGRLVDSVSGTFTHLNHRHWELPSRPCQPPSSVASTRAVSPVPSTHPSEEDSSIEENIPELAAPLRLSSASNDAGTSVADPTATRAPPAQATTSIPWNCLLDVCVDAAPVPPAPDRPKPPSVPPMPPKPVSSVALKIDVPEADSVPAAASTQRISGKRQSRPSARLPDSTAAPPPPAAAGSTPGSKRAVTPDETHHRGPAVAAPTPPVKRRLAVADVAAHARAPLPPEACGDASGVSPEPPRAPPLREVQPGQS